MLGVEGERGRLTEPRGGVLYVINESMEAFCLLYFAIQRYGFTFKKFL
jgi:hypothetical protein